MTKMMTAAVVAGLMSLSASFAGGDDSKKLGSMVNEVDTIESNFHGGNWEWRTEVGALTQYDKRDFQPAHYGQIMANSLVGLMLYDPMGPSVLRGNTEFLMGVSGGGVFEGPGSGIYPGLTLGFQYNFVQPDSKFVPYVALMSGFVFMDDKAKPQYVGSSFNFNSQAQVGFRYFLCKDWSLNVAGAWNHISNLDTTSNNHGISSVGGFVGVSYFFR